MPEAIRVLIAENDPNDADLMVHELRRAGFEPDWRRVQGEAEYLEALTPDLDVILSDYTMPEFDGPRALELLRARGLDVPFILVSGTVGEEMAVEAMKNGASDYLLKDRLGRLGAAVRQAIARRREHHERRRMEAELDANVRRLVEQAPLCIAMFDREMRYLATSQGWIAAYGRGYPDLIGRCHYDVCPDLPEVWKEAHRTRRGRRGRERTTRTPGCRPTVRGAGCAGRCIPGGIPGARLAGSSSPPKTSPRRGKPSWRWPRVKRAFASPWTRPRWGTPSGSSRRAR
jgi:CheY-like chemotaxis protein